MKQMDNKEGRQKTIERIIQTIEFKNIIKWQMDTVFLFSLDSIIGSCIDSMAHWLLGGSIRRKYKGYQIISKQPLINHEQKHLNSLVLHIAVNNDDNVRVIAIDASRQSKQPNQKTTLICDMLFLFALYTQNARKYSKQAKTKIIAAVQADVKQFQLEQNIKKATQFLCDNQKNRIQVICVDSRGQKLMQNGIRRHMELQFDKTKKISNTVQRQLKFKNNHDLELIIKAKMQPYDSQKFKKEPNPQNLQMKKYFQEMRKHTQQIQISLVKPIGQFISNYLYKNNGDLASSYTNLLNQMKQINEKTGGILQQQINQKSQKESNITKNDKQNAAIQLAYKSCTIRQNFSIDQRKKHQIKWMQQFYQAIFTQLSYLPEYFDESQISLLRKYAQLLIQQSHIIMKIGVQYFPPQVDPILSGLKVLDNKAAQVKSDDLILKIARTVLNSQLQRNKKPIYYLVIKQVIDQCFKIIKQSQKDYQILKSRKIKIYEMLPFYRFQAIVNQVGQSKKQIQVQFTQMKQFFQNFHKMQNQPNRFDMSLLLSIFAKSGHKLLSYGFPQLAIQVFKKVRFQHKIDEIAQYLIARNKTHQQKAAFYVQLSQYYDQIGNLQKSTQYMQKAHYAVPSNLQYVQRMIKANIKKNNPQQIKKVQQEMTKMLNNGFVSILSYKLPNQFYKEIKLIDANKYFEEIDTNYEEVDSQSEVCKRIKLV